MPEESTGQMTSVKFKLGVSLFVFLVGAVAGGWSMHELHQRQESIQPAVAETINQFRQETDEYDFIRPLLYCRLPESTILGEKDNLKKEIESQIEGIKQSNPGFEASVYYRDLDRGRWIGVNEETSYTPASLLKVVVMITYFKVAENDPHIFGRLIPFTQHHADLLARAPLDRGTELVIGETYTVDDLVNRMITKSDNGATYALLSSIDNKSLNQVYRDLELRNPNEANSNFTINAREYSYFLRILYNATYLERSLSERALNMLSHAEFREGLSKGVPPDIQISHKYGESITANGTSLNSLELHDCGIVYHPTNPYLLCVMTRGKDLPTLLQAIQTVSRIVYEDVAKEVE